MDSDITTYKTPIITPLIIVVNIIIFTFSLYGPTIPTGSTFSCLKQNHPQCLGLASNDRMRECGVSAIQRGKDPEECLYSLTKSCQMNFSEVEECFTPLQRTMQNYGAIPATTGIEKILRMFSSMFIHANWSHVIGNMLILFLTGIFLEARIGKLKYAVLYLASGIGADILHFLIHPDAIGPSVGASGAVFGVFGATLVMKFYKPHLHTTPKIGRFLFKEILPARYFIAVFFITIFSLVLLPESGIGYAAHLGGFISGFILIFFLMNDNETNQNVPRKNAFLR